MQFESTGKVISVLPTQSGNTKGGNPWVKNQFVIEINDNGYVQYLCLEVMGEDKWEKMKQNVVVGQMVMVKFGVSSREFGGKWFTSCQCFYCANVGGTNQQSGATDPSHAIPAGQAPAPQNDSQLPF